MGTPKLTALRNLLRGVSPGASLETERLEGLLVACWHQFTDADSEGMRAAKLIGRIENVCWEPPILSFEIERHGAVVLGSVYAEVQSWSVDLEELTASCAAVSRRLVGKQAARLQLEPFVDRVANALKGGTNDECLKWINESRVRILVGRIIPSAGPKETVEARRKRLRKAIEAALAPLGWQKVSGTSPHTYERTTSPENTS